MSDEPPPYPSDVVESAADALRASIRLSGDIVGVMDLMTGRGGLRMGLSDINRTATVMAMRQNAGAVLRFVQALEREGA